MLICRVSRVNITAFLVIKVNISANLVMKIQFWCYVKYAIK